MKKIDINRRRVLGSALLVGIGAFYGLSVQRDVVRIYAKETQVLLHLAYHLFPHSQIGPGSVDLHIAGYLHFVLNDKRIMKEDKDYFLKGGYWLEESAYEVYEASFINLNKEQKESLLQRVVTERWAENLIYTSLTYIFEALLSAPVYGSNIDSIGWDWLEHNPGFPQPKSIDEIRYEL